MVTEGVIYLLISNVELQDLVGRNKKDNKFKCYPVVCPYPEQFPYVVMRITKRVPFGECKDALPTSWETNFDIYSFHQNFDDCKSIDDQVIVALNGFEGITNSVDFQEIRIINASVDAYEKEHDGLFCKISTFYSITNENPA